MASTQPVAIVTGGASGIGLACVQLLLSRNYKVCIADANPKAGAAAVETLGSQNTMFFRLDVSDFSAQQRLFATAFTWGGGRLDFLAANAGIDDRQSLYEGYETMVTEKVKVNVEVGGGEDVAKEVEVDVPKELNLKTIRVDLDAVLQGVWLFKYFNRISRKEEGEGDGKGTRGGKVVVTSSAAGIYNIETNPQYGSAKHGLIGLVRSAAPSMLRKDNITLNAICPAFVLTNLAPRHVVDTFPKEHVTPMETIMKAYTTFLDDDNMTGQTVECSLDQLYFRQMPEWANASQKWMGEGSDGYWERAYEKVAEARNGV